MGRVSKHSLRAMERRWGHDLARLEAAWPDGVMTEQPIAEVIRNLATAITEIQMQIARQEPNP